MDFTRVSELPNWKASTAGAVIWMWTHGTAHHTTHESTNSEVWRRERQGSGMFLAIHYQHHLCIFFLTCTVKLKHITGGWMSRYKCPLAGNTALPWTRHPVREQVPLRLKAQRASEHVSSVEVEEKKYTRMMKMANLDTIISTTASSWSLLVPKLSQHVWDVEGFANTGGNNENPVCLQAFQMWYSPAGGRVSRLPMLLLLCSRAFFLIERSYN